MSLCVEVGPLISRLNFFIRGNTAKSKVGKHAVRTRVKGAASCLICCLLLIRLVLTLRPCVLGPITYGRLDNILANWNLPHYVKASIQGVLTREKTSVHLCHFVMKR